MGTLGDVDHVQTLPGTSSSLSFIPPLGSQYRRIWATLHLPTDHTDPDLHVLIGNPHVQYMIAKDLSPPILHTSS